MGESSRTATLSTQAHPIGSFSIGISKEQYRYYFDLQGTMIFQGDDFDFINSSHEETEFFITCDFRGVQWKGYFTKIECNTHVSKRYIEVTPIPDDDYRKIEPYMGVEMNILPRLHGFRADTVVTGVRQFKKERKTVEITEPYDGPNKENWVGYSVNDWIGGAENYDHQFFLERNSLFYYLYSKRREVVEESEEGYSFVGQNHWINEPYLQPLARAIVNFDYQGYMYAHDAEYTPEGLFNAMVPGPDHTPECFALSEVINHYEDGEWTKCELIYEREVWPGDSMPPIGATNFITQQMYHHIKNGGSPERFDGWRSLNNVVWLDTLGWMYDHLEDKWYRRPYGMLTSMDGENYFQRAAQIGDGRWYTGLIEIENTQKQALYFNRGYGTLQDMYAGEYGEMTVRGRYHRLPSLVNKFLAFVQDQGGELFPLSSKVLTALEFPIHHIDARNEWRTTLIGQNSDIKRPESSEKADIEEMSFEDFLNTICALSNTGWAVVDGVFYLEHAFFFENGFTYDEIVFEKGMPEEEDFLINPMGIKNLDKDMNFLKLSDEYRYDRPDMQKIEKFITSGGREPQHNNTRIFYPSPLTNNLPKENTREITMANITGDHDWILSDEAPDAGLGYLQAELTDYEMKPDGEDTSQEGRVVLLTLPESSALEFTFHKEGSASVSRTISRSSGENLLDVIEAFKTAFNADKPFGSVTVYSVNLHIRFPDLCSITFYDADGSDLLPLGITPLYGGAEGSQGTYVHTEQEESMDIDYYVYQIPFTLDEFSRYRVNEDFTLEDIVWRYHWYGRSFKRGEINGENREFLTRHFVHHDISFPYRHQLDPYKKILTNFGAGIIKQASFNAKTGLFDVTVGYQEGSLPQVVTPDFDPPPGEKDLVAGIYFYRHVQEDPAQEWYVHHPLGTSAFLRPIVYAPVGDTLEEIQYESLIEVTENYCILTFTRPVSGEAYFLSFGLYPTHEHVQTTASTEWTINHGLNTENILHSVVWQNGLQIAYDRLSIESPNQVKLFFTRAVAGKIYVAESPVGTIAETGTEITISRDKNYPLKPLVMYMNKEVGYNSNIVEDSLIKLGFTKEVIATIILMQHD